MNTELSAIMAKDGRLVEFSNKVVYKAPLDAEDKDISEVLDAWAKEIGNTGLDANHEISALVRKAITKETVTAPTTLIERTFEQGNIGEFDDVRGNITPDNTIVVHEAVAGGNVDRSFIDNRVIAPKWTSLQAETDISLADMRRGGYKTVANLITYIQEALEYKKVKLIMDIIDNNISNGDANYISESTSAPTVTSVDELSVYLQDVTNGDVPVIFSTNKYINAISKLAGAQSFGSDALKDMYNTTGVVNMYAGNELVGISGQKKIGGELVIPDKRIFGFAGKIGTCITRGDTQALQETDINSEKIHLKVTGYTFGTMISDIKKAGKIVLA